jgi:hypothetical protein
MAMHQLFHIFVVGFFRSFCVIASPYLPFNAYNEVSGDGTAFLLLCGVDLSKGVATLTMAKALRTKPEITSC